MYHKMDEEKLKEIEELTMTDYEKVGEFIPVDSIDAIIDDLLFKIHKLTEEIEDKETDKDTYMADIYHEDKMLGLI